jgi:5'(3')-deoxyribonucleotidase
MGTKHNRADVRVEPVGISPKEIAFDIDGVVADTFSVFVQIAQTRYGYQFGYEDITEYDFMNVIDIDEEISDTIIRSLVDHPLENGVKPLRGAVQVLTRLSEVCPLLFVTARHDKRPIMRWLLQQLPHVKGNRLRLKATSSHDEKLPILLENGIRYFVDDRLETAYLLEQFSITPIIFEQPWNRKSHPFAVVNNWEDIERLITW